MRLNSFKFFYLLILIIILLLSVNEGRAEISPNIAEGSLSKHLEKFPLNNDKTPGELCDVLKGNQTIWHGKTYKPGKGNFKSYLWKIEITADDIISFGNNKDIKALEEWMKLNKKSPEELPRFECYYRADSRKHFSPPKNLEDGRALISKSEPVAKNFVSQERVINRLSFVKRSIETLNWVGLVGAWGGCAAASTVLTAGGAGGPGLPAIIAGCSVFAASLRAAPKGFGTDSSWGTKGTIELAKKSSTYKIDETESQTVPGTAIDRLTSTVSNMSKKTVRDPETNTRKPRSLQIDCPKPEDLIK